MFANFFGLGLPEIIILALMGLFCLAVAVGAIVLAVVLSRRQFGGPPQLPKDKRQED